MRRVSIQVEIREEDDTLILIFTGRYNQHREIVPFATLAARKVNHHLYYTLRAILQEYQPAGTVEGSITHEDEEHDT